MASHDETRINSPPDFSKSPVRACFCANDKCQTIGLRIGKNTQNIAEPRCRIGWQVGLRRQRPIIMRRLNITRRNLQGTLR